MAEVIVINTPPTHDDFEDNFDEDQLREFANLVQTRHAPPLTLEESELTQTRVDL